LAEKILIVEDEITRQETLAYNLRRQRNLVEVIGDGLAVLNSFRESKTDLIVLDIMLPNLVD